MQSLGYFSRSSAQPLVAYYKDCNLCNHVNSSYSPPSEALLTVRTQIKGGAIYLDGKESYMIIIKVLCDQPTKMSSLQSSPARVSRSQPRNVCLVSIQRPS